jgi:very-short-patch-repair endonuclease
MEKSQCIDKATRLIEYLIRLADLQRKSIKDIANYEQILWFNDIPNLKGCFTQAWGADKEYDDSIWLEVQTRREPPLPKIPNICKDWVNSSVLRTKTEMPLLYETITRQVENPNWIEGSDQPQFFSESDNLENYPEVQRKWESYIEDQWIPWTEDHNQWEVIQGIYSKLFSIYQEQLKLGEEFELVVGVGLLTWQTPERQQIRRHLLVATAALEFESQLGKFTVRPNPDGANLRTELDMLENAQPPKAEEVARQGLVSADDNPWARNVTDGVLEGLIHSIDSKGEYYDRLQPEAFRSTEKPIVEYAPTLILRKRSARGLTETLRKLKEQIQSGGEIPAEFKDLAEIRRSAAEQQGDESDLEGKTERVKPVFDGEIYFPKPSNKEQRKIIERLNHSNGVLVQGPPGTGKSHTIANLICHLLATGKRILVTAKTPRALQVIERQLPEQMRPLCVNLLGGGAEERQSLENSMGAVLQKTQSWNARDSKERQQEFEEKLSHLRMEKAAIENRLCAIREAETHTQTIVDGIYRGTAVQIVRQIQGESSKCDWLTDRIHFDVTCPLENPAGISLLKGLRALSSENRQELQAVWPQEVPNESELVGLFSTEKALKAEESRLIQSADNCFFEQLVRQNDFSVDAVLKPLGLLQDSMRKLNALPYGWVGDALREMTAGHEATWRELHGATEKSLASIADFVGDADRIHFTCPEGSDLKVVCQDAEKLHEFFFGGGKLGWGPFHPSSVRPFLYITKKVFVDGKPCKDSDCISLLIKALRVQLEMNALWSLWCGKIAPVSGPYNLQYHEIKAHFDALSQILEARKLMYSCQSVIYGWYSELPVAWNQIATLNSFVQACRLALTRASLRDTEKKIFDTTSPILAISRKANPHRLVRELLDAVELRSIDDFRVAAKKAEAMNDQKVLMLKTDAVLKTVSAHAPGFASCLFETADYPCWDERLSNFKSAWNWARAHFWLYDYINKEDVVSLGDRLLQVDYEIGFTVSSLAAEKAWAFCFSRMSEQHRRHMEAWQQHIKKLGKGTGKYAAFHRKEAQSNLEQCREAVPAWVMPLHRVWDTVSPSPDMFDVIIVDEASQCGLESLPLFYMCKKILIVGDDKQISPDAVGVPLDAVHRLMDEYLHDFRFKADAFDVTSSLFYQAKLRYSAHKVVLREHFRCMPEIIRFSNEQCYSSEPLIPLRQYGADRLKPLERRYVEGGYKEGTGSRVINRPEAKAIVDKIVELCLDPQYEDKTMGVVILQGEAQASLIETMLLGRLGADEIERRRLICGNPYSFQGDERDVVFLSMVAASNDRVGALAKSSDEQRFNVAASRAKDQMWLFHSVTRNDLSQTCSRSKLLAFFEGTKVEPILGVDCDELEKKVFDANRSIVKAPAPFDSWFEVDIALELARKKYLVIPQFEVAGKYIDLVVDGGGARLAVECDGDAFHGADHYVQDMERQKILERCGWPFFRIRESEFYADKETGLTKLWRTLEARGIYPVDAMDILAADEKEKAAETSSDEDSSDQKDVPGGGNRANSNVDLDGPSDIHEAMHMKYRDLRDAIIATLNSRPNHSCVKDAVVKFLLQYLEIISRGKPRDAFTYKVNQSLDRMAKAGVVKIYTATNERVKLEPEPYLSMALGKDLLKE